MSKYDKGMGIERVADQKRQPVVEPHKTLSKPRPKKSKPFVLVETVEWRPGRTWKFKHRYATEEARRQGRASLEHNCWRASKNRTLEEINE